MKYLTIYRPYNIPAIKKLAKSNREDATYQESRPLVDWNDAIEKYAKDGWRVIKCGTIVSGEDAIFWAMLEKS